MKQHTTTMHSAQCHTPPEGGQKECAHANINAVTTLSTLQDLRPEDYTYQLSPADVAEIISGTDHILAQGVKDEEDIKKVDD
jgi:hypothetical protein